MEIAVVAQSNQSNFPSKLDLPQGKDSVKSRGFEDFL
jgi:hypothetical protein